MTDNYTKKQHYIPRFLLENFTDKNGYIWALDKQTGKIFPNKPENVACRNHLYSVGNDADEKDDALEKDFARLEGKAAPIVKDILQFKQWPKDKINAEYIFHFLCCAALRSPHIVKGIGKFTDSACERVFLDSPLAYTIEDYIQAKKILGFMSKNQGEIYSVAFWYGVNILKNFISRDFIFFLDFPQNEIILNECYSSNIYCSYHVNPQKTADIDYCIFPLASYACLIGVNRRLLYGNKLQNSLTYLKGKGGVNIFTAYSGGRYLYGGNQETLQQAAANAKIFAEEISKC